MSREVVVANRLGIALAADSAVAFTNGSAARTTDASGANKFFQRRRKNRALPNIVLCHLSALVTDRVRSIALSAPIEF
jgi:hypothetical protein